MLHVIIENIVNWWLCIIDISYVTPIIASAISTVHVLVNGCTPKHRMLKTMYRNKLRHRSCLWFTQDGITYPTHWLSIDILLEKKRTLLYGKIWVKAQFQMLHLQGLPLYLLSFIVSSILLWEDNMHVIINSSDQAGWFHLGLGFTDKQDAFSRTSAFFLAVLCCSLLPLTEQQYTPDWASIDSRPLPAVGMMKVKLASSFNWGVYSVPSIRSEWCVTFRDKNTNSPSYHTL